MPPSTRLGMEVVPMSADIIKFPGPGSRGSPPVPRRSKPGASRKAHSEIDRRKLRGNPLREHVATISFGATVVGRMHTAGLKGEPLSTIHPEIRKEWLETLDRAFEALATVAGGISQATKTLKALETSDFTVTAMEGDQ